MKTLNSEQMRAADQAAINDFKIPSLNLMENAGKGLVDFISKKFNPEKDVISIFVGKGNNGGDGLVCARILIQKGYEVIVFMISQIADLSADAKANWERLAALTPKIIQINDIIDLKTDYPMLARSSCIIDAIFGTGLTNDVKTPYKEIINFINEFDLPVIACDIPSGLSADTGLPLGISIKAKFTVTFGLAKKGLFIGEGERYAGKVKVVDIGIPETILDSFDSDIHIVDTSYFKNILTKRDPKSHKGSFGHVLVIAGSNNKLGAGYLSCMAALRSGAGLVTYALPEKSFEKFDARYPEIMVEAIPDKKRGHFHIEGLNELIGLAKDKTVVALGPAIGTHKETEQLVFDLLRQIHLPLVIDADALNLIANNISILSQRNALTILTPHPGEMQRLMKTQDIKLEKNRIPLAKKLATEQKVYVVLKGNRTVIATPQGKVYINLTGNAAMATAGMGDALTGMISGYIAQGFDPEKAIIMAVYFHGLAGDIAAKRFGDRGVITSDVIKIIPEVVKKAMSLSSLTG